MIMIGIIVKTIIFLLGSAAILKISWPDIFNTSRRNFYLFFALEFFLILILAYSGYWLRNPFTPFRIFCWLILFGAFVLAGYGVYQLLQFGKPSAKNNIETTTYLVTTGVYRYIRHPLYSALIAVGAISLFKSDFPWLMAICLFCVATVFLYATARIEDQENTLKFGEEYAVYIDRTRMFVPYIF
jgi:protein-S-isoprenylcysteine O-methyltransferase Ste14